MVGQNWKARLLTPIKEIFKVWRAVGLGGRYERTDHEVVAGACFCKFLFVDNAGVPS